jgi:hypothetical protein
MLTEQTLDLPKFENTPLAVVVSVGMLGMLAAGPRRVQQNVPRQPF